MPTLKFMDTLLRVHNKLDFLHPINGFSDRFSQLNISTSKRPCIRLAPKRPNLKWGKNGCVRASSNALLELVPETKKEVLEFELPMYDPSKGIVMDLAVVGGGPAGLAVAQQVSSAGLSVCSIDPFPKLIWPNNYGVWVDEFEAMDLLDCLDTTWSGAVVYIDDRSKKELDRPYGRVNRKQLKSKMMQKCISNGVKFHQAKVIKVIHEESKSLLICNDGVTVQASVVLDATGFSRCLVQYDKPYNPGYQVAYGILAEVEGHPFELDKMVFMDWRDSHLDGNKKVKGRNSKIPTFLYAMPFSSGRVFLEETSLVARPGVPIEDIQERMVARLRHLGIKVKSIEEDERCVIPMGGPLPVIPQRIVGIGGTAGMVHPSTGYMVARTLAASPIIANSIVQYLGSERFVLGDDLSADVWKELWPIERRRQREFFCFGAFISGAVLKHSSNMRRAQVHCANDAQAPLRSTLGAEQYGNPAHATLKSFSGSPIMESAHMHTTGDFYFENHPFNVKGKSYRAQSLSNLPLYQWVVYHTTFLTLLVKYHKTTHTSALQKKRLALSASTLAQLTLGRPTLYLSLPLSELPHDQTLSLQVLWH